MRALVARWGRDWVVRWRRIRTSASRPGRSSRARCARRSAAQPLRLLRRRPAAPSTSNFDEFFNSETAIQPRMDLTQVLEISSSTDPGMVRSHNEDSVAADAANGLVLLADGMGGYNAGEGASRMATTGILTEMQPVLQKAQPYEVG